MKGLVFDLWFQREIVHGGEKGKREKHGSRGRKMADTLVHTGSRDEIKRFFFKVQTKQLLGGIERSDQ